MGLHNAKLSIFLKSFVFCYMVCFMSAVLCACGDEDKLIFTPLQWAAQESGKQAGVLTDRDGAEDSGELSEKACAVIYVHVCGAVISPGVKALPEGSRAVDALEAAGGFTQEADPAAVNLASKVQDGQKLYFPTGEETSAEDAQRDERINLNTADKEKLEELPGIGSAKAEAIVRYRKEHGSFERIEELLQVPGIYQSLYDQIRDRIRLSDHDFGWD